MRSIRINIFFLLICWIIVGCDIGDTSSPVDAERDIAQVAVRPYAILRNAPSTQSDAIEKLFFGYNVKVIERTKNEEEILGLTGSWVKVQFLAGRTAVEAGDLIGWIFEPLLRYSGEEKVFIILNGKVADFNEPRRETVAQPDGIFWMLCNYGQNYVEGKCTGQSEVETSAIRADAYCKSLSVDGKAWRLPEANELITLEAGVFNEIFPYSENGAYITQTIGSNGSEEYYFSVLVPQMIKASLSLDGVGFVKCVSP